MVSGASVIIFSLTMYTSLQCTKHFVCAFFKYKTEHQIYTDPMFPLLMHWWICTTLHLHCVAAKKKNKKQQQEKKNRCSCGSIYSGVLYVALKRDEYIVELVHQLKEMQSEWVDHTWTMDRSSMQRSAWHSCRLSKKKKKRTSNLLYSFLRNKLQYKVNCLRCDQMDTRNEVQNC